MCKIKNTTLHKSALHIRSNAGISVEPIIALCKKLRVEEVFLLVNNMTYIFFSFICIVSTCNENSCSKKDLI